MATMQAPPAPPNGRSLLGHAAIGAAPVRRGRTLGRALSRAVGRLVPYLGTLAGLGCLSAAAYTVALWAGLLVTGVACLALEWHVTRPAPERPNR